VSRSPLPDGGVLGPVGIGHGSGPGEQLADGAGSVDADRVAVEQAEAGAIGAGGVGEPVPEDLHPGAHRQHRRPGLDGSVQGPALGQLAGGLDLGAVLSAPDQVQVARVGCDVAGRHGHDLDRDVAPGEAAGEHGGVAAVAVGAQQVGEEHPDANGRLARRGHRGPPTISRYSWNAV
jgi:hypothetical protein